MSDCFTLTKRCVASAIADRRAATAVEFALVALLLIALIGFIFTISIVLQAHHTVSHYAREAARGVALGYMTVTEAKTFAEHQANTALRVGVVAEIDPATRGSSTDRDVVVTLSISEQELGKLTPFGRWVPKGVTTRVVMRSLVE